MTGSAETRVEPASVERLLEAAAATMAKTPYCWAVTVAQDSSVNARPMGWQKWPASEDPFCVFFLTRRGTRKTLELGRSGRLSVIYQHDADDGYLTLIGRGFMVTDPAVLKAQWQPAWNRFFPNGADDPAACFVQFETDRIELWVRGVTPEPFGTRGSILERGPAQVWRLVQ